MGAGLNVGHELQCVVWRVRQDNHCDLALLGFERPNEGWRMWERQAAVGGADWEHLGKFETLSLLPVVKERVEAVVEYLREMDCTCPKCLLAVSVRPMGEHWPIEIFDERAGVEGVRRIWL